MHSKCVVRFLKTNTAMKWHTHKPGSTGFGKAAAQRTRQKTGSGVKSGGEEHAQSIIRMKYSTVQQNRINRCEHISVSAKATEINLLCTRASKTKKIRRKSEN